MSDEKVETLEAPETSKISGKKGRVTRDDDRRLKKNRYKELDCFAGSWDEVCAAVSRELSGTARHVFNYFGPPQVVDNSAFYYHVSIPELGECTVRIPILELDPSIPIIGDVIVYGKTTRSNARKAAKIAEYWESTKSCSTKVKAIPIWRGGAVIVTPSEGDRLNQFVLLIK